jgi:cellulose synthase/poly-beta-1,6-N-acetylglucosamine synthase-like glycosyltransferase
MTIALLLLGALALALAGLYAAVTFVNLTVFHAPSRKGRASAPVSVLIPARDEAANIGACVEAVLAQQGAEIEVLVLDDGSTDGTGDIVSAIAARDGRLRLIEGGTLPAGWNGKQHACYQLAAAARSPLLLFLDADVRLAPDAVARMANYLERGRLDLVSGFPRQITKTLPEMVVIPQILVLLLGYLPFPMARVFRSVGFAAGCGQLMLVRAGAYRTSGGHASFRTSMHDGLHLPRSIRLSGGRTDILDATPLAHVRMYDNWPDIWAGFSKNATEGMAKPVALPIWTMLLGGGHILPPVVLLAALALGAPVAAKVAGLATVLLFAARASLAWKMRQHPLSVLLHPVGVGITLWIQWAALTGARRGERRVWRGRSYDVN